MRTDVLHGAKEVFPVIVLRDVLAVIKALHEMDWIEVIWMTELVSLAAMFIEKIVEVYIYSISRGIF
jgi:hypothetical protein